MTETNLLPCPFCGSKQVFAVSTQLQDLEETVCITCTTCKQYVVLECNEGEGFDYETLTKAKAAWNTRAETCELEEVESYSNANEVIHVLECSECGETCEHTNGSYPICPHCGRKVVER